MPGRGTNPSGAVNASSSAGCSGRRPDGCGASPVPSGDLRPAAAAAGTTGAGGSAEIRATRGGGSERAVLGGPAGADVAVSPGAFVPVWLEATTVAGGSGRTGGGGGRRVAGSAAAVRAGGVTRLDDIAAAGTEARCGGGRGACARALTGFAGRGRSNPATGRLGRRNDLVCLAVSDSGAVCAGTAAVTSGAGNGSGTAAWGMGGVAGSTGAWTTGGGSGGGSTTCTTGGGGAGGITMCTGGGTGCGTMTGTGGWITFTGPAACAARAPNAPAVPMTQHATVNLRTIRESRIDRPAVRSIRLALSAQVAPRREPGPDAKS